MLLHVSAAERVEVLRMFDRALAPGGLLATEQTQKMPQEMAGSCERPVPDGQLFRKAEADAVEGDRQRPGSGAPMPKAMVLDDSRAIRRILAAILGDVGYEVCQASHGREAIEVLDEQFRRDVVGQAVLYRPMSA